MFRRHDTSFPPLASVSSLHHHVTSPSSNHQCESYIREGKYGCQAKEQQREQIPLAAATALTVARTTDQQILLGVFP